MEGGVHPGPRERDERQARSRPRNEGRLSPNPVYIFQYMKLYYSSTDLMFLKTKFRLRSESNRVRIHQYRKTESSSAYIYIYIYIYF